MYFMRVKGRERGKEGKRGFGAEKGGGREDWKHIFTSLFIDIKVGLIILLLK